MVTNSEARAELRAAHAELAKAEAAFATAQRATDRARQMLDAAIRDNERQDAASRQAADALVDQARDAIAAGCIPSISTGSKNAVARAELEARRVTAERIVSDFAAASRSASDIVGTAKEAVAKAIRVVIKSEAESLAARWAIVDAEAQAVRARLGRVYGPVWRLEGLGGDVSRAISMNEDDRLDLEENHTVADAWTDFADALTRNPEARPDFVALDRVRGSAREERTQSQAAIERIVAQMRAPANVGGIQ
jgi:hypothetical protein